MLKLMLNNLFAVEKSPRLLTADCWQSNMNIAVFCSSSNHIADHYRQSAFQLGELIAEDGNALVYGGATGGLMDSVAEGAKSKNEKDYIEHNLEKDMRNAKRERKEFISKAYKLLDEKSKIYDIIKF